ncbi:MAG TPA: flagellar hook-basal body complex protein FliE [Methanoculleus sp.]|nr:flagellar hook-basal body complex protein FliE [Methanoculleus sp.]
MKVIGVVGLPASGKGEFSRIAGDMGIPVVVMGDVIRDVLIERGLPPTDENLGAVSRELREKNGRAAIAERCIPRINAQDAPLVLVDGIRSDAEVAVFREAFENFTLIGVDAPFELRFQRLNDRKRSDDPADEESMRARDARELGWGLGRALEMADATISNDGSIQEFRDEVIAILKGTEA